MSKPATTIIMSRREVDRLKTIRAVVDRLARVGQAVRLLGLSRRQLERLIQRYKVPPVWSRASEARQPATRLWGRGPSMGPVRPIVENERFESCPSSCVGDANLT